VKAFLLLFLLLACVGCATQAEYVKADEATYNAIAPEYDAYVLADAKLTDAEKERRARLVKSWALRIRESR